MKIKIFLCTFSLMIFACTSAVDADTYYDTIDYAVCGDTVVITGIEGTPEALQIPGMINGKRVTEIRDNAFYKCDTLKKIIIPETVTKIGHHAFYQCTALESAEINAKVSEIGEGGFFGCESLTDINLPNSLKNIDDYCFYNCSSLENIEFPERLQTIGEYAFAGCSELNGLSLPKKLLNIGNYAFYECTALKSITVPDSVINIGSCSFGFYGDGDNQNRLKGFSISGDDNSLGKTYAELNSMKFENICKEKNSKKYSALPAAIVIASAAGLMFFRFLEKLKFFRRKYEYEH